jgi:hypothetical protein
MVDTLHQLDTWQQATFRDYLRLRGCCLCRGVWVQETRAYFWYVNDGAVDDRTQRSARRSLGFCPRHAVDLAIMEGTDYVWSHLGLSMVYADILRHRIVPAFHRLDTYNDQRPPRVWTRARLAALRRRLTPHALCPLCLDQKHVQQTQIQAFVRIYASQPGFRAAYDASDSLCLPHFCAALRALERQDGLATTEALTRRQIAHVAAIRSALGMQRQRLPEAAVDLLYGRDTRLWMEKSARLVPRREFDAPPCPACAALDRAMEATLAIWFSPDARSRDVDPRGRVLLPLCDWHGWLMHTRCARTVRQSAGIASVLSATLAYWEHALMDDATQLASQRPRRHLWTAHPRAGWERSGTDESCQLCVRLDKAEPVCVSSTWHHLGLTDPTAGPRQWCLPHIRRLLQQGASGADPLAVAQVAAHLAHGLFRQLDGYVTHSAEQLQQQMTPEEADAWYACLFWFGGHDAVQALVGNLQTGQQGRRQP